MTEQQREIETIKPRTFHLNLSDADVERIFEKAGQGGITPERLLQNFIGDLVDGTYSNGSDERMFANKWFDRCWFGTGNAETFLAYLLYFGYDVEDLVVYYQEMEYLKTEEGRAEFERTEVGEAAREKEIAFFQNYIDECYDEYKAMYPYAESLEEEMKTILDWQQRKADMLAGDEQEETIMSKIIAVANQKGGVGKTTTAMNLGAALALKHNQRVLLVDLDAQANLSEYLGFEGNDGKPTVTELFAQVASQAVIPADLVKSSIRHNELNNVDYIPSTINLANADVFLLNALSRETVLKRILTEEITSTYDYVLIDCLPSLGVLLLNALTAADSMLIPVQVQKFSMDGLQALTALYGQVRATINPQLTLIGVLPTMVDNTVPTKNALRTLAENYPDTLFGVRIHRSVEAAKSSESGKALCITSGSRLGEEYTALAAEVMCR